MKWLKSFRYLFVCLGIIVLFFVIASLFDIMLIFVYPRFYSHALFIVCFGVAGIFAAFIGYMQAISLAPAKNEWARWSLISLMILTGLILFFLLSELEGGEYRIPFKAFGLTLALSAAFFMKGKPD